MPGIIIKGDVEGVGRITPIGLTLLRMHLLDEIQFDERSRVAADINNDVFLNATDAALIAYHLSGEQIISEVVEE